MNDEYDMQDGPDEDLIPALKCEVCGHNMCKDEMAGDTCIYCQTRTAKEWEELALRRLVDKGKSLNNREVKLYRKSME